MTARREAERFPESPSQTPFDDRGSHTAARWCHHEGHGQGVGHRRWFRDRGFEEIGFASADGAGWGVGANRLVVDSEAFQHDVHLFTFLDDLRAAEERPPHA